jgi:hypothetical protein
MIVGLTVTQYSPVRIPLLPSPRQTLSVPGWFFTEDGTIQGADLARGSSQRYKKHKNLTNVHSWASLN